MYFKLPAEKRNQLIELATRHLMQVSWRIQLLNTRANVLDILMEVVTGVGSSPQRVHDDV